MYRLSIIIFRVLLTDFFYPCSKTVCNKKKYFNYFLERREHFRRKYTNAAY